MKDIFIHTNDKTCQLLIKHLLSPIINLEVNENGLFEYCLTKETISKLKKIHIRKSANNYVIDSTQIKVSLLEPGKLDKIKDAA